MRQILGQSILVQVCMNLELLRVQVTRSQFIVVKRKKRKLYAFLNFLFVSSYYVTCSCSVENYKALYSFSYVTFTY